jgi:uncharacterized membrane protein YkoI
MRCSLIGRACWTLAGALFGVMLVGGSMRAQAAPRSSPQQAMAAEARISKEQARMTAMSRVPGGRMSFIELRRGISGRLIYTAVIQAPGKPRKTEVMIDAMTGIVLSTR